MASVSTDGGTSANGHRPTRAHSNQQTEGGMSKAEMKAMIEQTARETSVPVARLITAMQGQLARMGDEAGLVTLCELKRDYIGA
jgi:hypothetical protein